MVIRVSRKNNNKYDITTRGGNKIHTDKDINFVLEYLKNQLQTGFQEIRIIV